MAVHWIDRLARATAGARLKPRRTSSAAAIDEQRFSRGTALSSAALFGLAAVMPALRPAVAWGADACTVICQKYAQQQADRYLIRCAGPGPAPVLTPFVHPFMFQNLGCAALIGNALLIDENLCRLDAVSKRAGGDCAYREKPPPLPRTIDRTYPPEKPADPTPRGKRPPKKKPPKKKQPPPRQPPKTPGTCGGITCHGGDQCCPSPTGPRCCLPRGCDPGGDGCCKSGVPCK